MATDYVDADQDNKPKTRKRQANGRFARKDENVLSPEDLRGLVRDGSSYDHRRSGYRLWNDEQLIEQLVSRLVHQNWVPVSGSPELSKPKLKLRS